jgi:hypothetical protein
MLKNNIALPVVLACLAFMAGMALPAAAVPTPGKDDAVSEKRISAQDSRDIVQPAEAPVDTAAVLYRVMGVILFIWFGLAAFLFSLDRRVAKLEKASPDPK